ncbi:hypothetical protein niasHS_014451 [Heterodera schachtii]|uniref:G-protein coupled receptors family 1 profile domain-containing protein n=1 Tax=Heterodera schachtii TaxID=97005 RepID=A0ABD2I6W3_HETSC
MEKPVVDVVHLSVPECLQQSPQQCREVHINARVPIEWALPLYGFLMPLIVAITILTNSFIVIVLSHRSLRTPTNFVLGAMAITELLTGLLGLPWLLYFYTFGGFRTYEWEGLPALWCTMFPYLTVSLPSIFHTRYIYICVPKLVQSLCTIRRSKQMIVSIFVVSLWIYAPELFASYNQSFQFVDSSTNRTRSMCVMHRTALIQLVGNDLYHMMYYTVHTIIVHTLPCILLVFFTWRLITAIREADKKHCNLIRKKSHLQHPHQQQQQRKFTVTTPDSCGTLHNGGAGADSCCNNSYCNNGTASTVAAEMPTISNGDAGGGGAGGGTTATVSSSASSCGSNSQQRRTSSQQQHHQQEKQRGSFSESKRVQGIRQNTRMLLTVILLFLVTEIPAALIFGMHVGAVALNFTFLQPRHYAIINKLLIVRNVLIVISYPLRFAIYCGMSAQFREVVKQMLAKRKMLFHHFSYGKLGSGIAMGSGGGGGVRPRVGSGARRSEEAERSSTSMMARKTSSSTVTMGLIVQQQQQKDTVIWRNGLSAGAIGGGGGRDEITAKLIKKNSSGENNNFGGGGGYLARQITTVATIGEEGGKEEEEVEKEEKNDDVIEEEDEERRD